jgi:DNA-binding XRE family transcriptional regulator
MITNERQYKITKNQLEAFEQAHAQALAKEPAPGVHPRIHQAMQEGLASQIDDLREQIERYQALKAGLVPGTVVNSVLGLLPALIEARIAAGLTQRMLSERLGIAEQQVQRYEATTYAGVSIERVQAVADAVGLRITEELTYHIA